MGDERTSVTLAETSLLLSRGVTPSYTEKGGVRVLNQKCIREQTVSLEPARRTDPNIRAVPNDKFLRSFDILINSTGEGTLGRVAQIKTISEPTTVDSHVTILRPNPHLVDPRFLGFLVRWLQPKIEQLAEGSTGQTELPRNRLGAFEVDLPSKSDQKAIAQILGALDDKIELNRRMNATLETMAMAQFQSWFVNFDPVRYKLDGRESPSLDKATAALFPALFQDSPIGPVPKGWKVERFDAHITAERGLSYNGAGLRNDGSGLPMHNLNSVYEGGGYKHEGIKYYGGEYREKHTLKPGDMIVTNTEQGFDHLLIGHAAIVPECYGDSGLFSHHIYRVRHKPSSPFSPHYLVELFNNRRWHYWVSGFSNGTTINMLPMDALEMPMLVVPPTDLVKKFTALAEAIHLRIETNLQESRTLATLREALLPQLLGGGLNLTSVTSSN